MKPIKKGMTEAVTRDGRVVTGIVWFDGCMDGAFSCAAVIDGEVETFRSDGIYLFTVGHEKDLFAPVEYEYQMLVKSIIKDEPNFWVSSNHWKDEDSFSRAMKDETIVSVTRLEESRRECK